MILDFLEYNWLTLAIFVIGTIISIIISYYFYRKGLIKNELAYKEKSIKILDIENELKLPNIKILHFNNEIKRLTKTYIVLWNNGDKTIEYNDILEKDKLKIKFNSNDGEILEARIVKAVRSVNDFKIDNTKNDEIEILFDFIDKGDGILIEVLQNFENYNVIISGTIKSMPKGIHKYGSEDMVFLLEDKKIKINDVLKTYLANFFMTGIFSVIVKNENIFIFMAMVILVPIPGLLIMKFLFKPKFPKELI